MPLIKQASRFLFMALYCFLLIFFSFFSRFALAQRNDSQENVDDKKVHHAQKKQLQDVASEPETLKSGYSPYEKETIERVLRSHHWKMDEAPQKKKIESIEVVRLEVLEESDPLPAFAIRFLNTLHTTSQEHVIRNELLISPGDEYSEALIDESARNLRKLAPISLVVTVAIQSKDPSKVTLLVIVKDVWSLRLNWDVKASSSGLESLTISPSELNVGGLHHTAKLDYLLLPKSHTFGLTYSIPRFGESYFGAGASATITVNRDTGHPEGSSASLNLSSPLRHSRLEWGFSALISYNNDVYRRYVNAAVAGYDATSTPEKEEIPYEYRRRNVTAGVALARSFGWVSKQDFLFGFDVIHKEYDTLLSGSFSAAAENEFRLQVPKDDRRVNPYLILHTYLNRFQRITDFDTFALQEDYRLGLDIYLQIYPVLKTFGSSRSFFGTFASLQYTLPLANGMIRASTASRVEWQASSIPDASLQADLYLLSPSFTFGRLIYDASLTYRYRNYLNNRSELGGNTRLRGYPSSYLIGKDVISSNLEFRTKPLRVWSTELGSVFFYDVGAAGDGLDRFKPLHSVGAGIRLLLPQLNRAVFRFDIGFPLEKMRPHEVSPVSFFFTFGQAFPFASASP